MATLRTLVSRTKLLRPATRGFASAAHADTDVFLVGLARTPIGGFGGSLSSMSAPQLGAVAIKGAMERAGVSGEQIDAVIMGNVLSGGLGQAPARQAALAAELPHSVVCTTVNKVCSSGMKAIMLAAQEIALGQSNVVVAGGMESMSNAPYLLPGVRTGLRMGNGTAVDSLLGDGLMDPYDNVHMGEITERFLDKCPLSRDDQDAYAERSYQRAAAAQAAGQFAEIVPVTVPAKKRGAEPTVVVQDEEAAAYKPGRVASARPAFRKTGSVTAANASTISDGAAAVVVASGKAVRELGLTPVARILGYADAERAPDEFGVAPSLALPKALQHAGVEASAVDVFEINEAFSAVAVENCKLLGLDDSKLNVLGGAVSLGHPIGASGCRIVTTLHTALGVTGGSIGAAGICNGGGGASAIVIERL